VTSNKAFRTLRGYPATLFTPGTPLADFYRYNAKRGDYGAGDATTARYEIDVFKGKHRGLVIAEIELPTERARFERPQWLGKEVTGEKRYYNATLASS
jgi:hypothetical protein